MQSCRRPGHATADLDFPMPTGGHFAYPDHGKLLTVFGATTPSGSVMVA
jgi:hypothetical protein